MVCLKGDCSRAAQERRAVLHQRCFEEKAFDGRMPVGFVPPHVSPGVSSHRILGGDNSGVTLVDENAVGRAIERRGSAVQHGMTDKAGED